MPASSWLIWDRLREFTRSNRIYQQERILQDQSSLDRLTVGGEFLDFSNQSAILEQTNLQINRLERYKDYEQMDQTGEISLALDLYADEASLIDPEKKHALIIRANNKRIKEELEELFHGTLLWDRMARPLIRYLCKYGDYAGEIVLDRDRSGVSSLRFMNIYNFTRVETRYGDLVGFFYQDELRPEPMFLHPWACMHLRLTSFENIFHPYGRAILDGGRKAFKQLRLMEDAALIYRITRAPEKRKYKIPVGIIPPKEIPEYMQAIGRIFKRQRFYNPTTGTFDERYSPIVQEDDFFLPQRPDGSGPDVEVLPGGDNMDKIQDIEYFKKKMIAPMKIPYARVGIGEGAGEPNEKSLSQSSAEFAKAVKWVQAEVAYGLTKVAIIHLSLRGYPVEDIKGFELSLPSSSAIEDLYRMETWQTRTGVMMELNELGWFPKKWIVTNFTDLSPDEIEDLDEMTKEESGAGGAGLGGGGGALGGGEELGGEGELGGEEELDLGGGGGEEPGGGEEEAPVEGFDYELEKKILMEMREGASKDRGDNAFRRLLSRRKIHGLFTNLLELNELDGLSTKGRDRETVLNEGVHPSDPNSDEGLMVGWSVPEDDRLSAIEETATLLVALASHGESASTEDDEINDNDLPPPA